MSMFSLHAIAVALAWIVNVIASTFNFRRMPMGEGRGERGRRDAGKGGPRQGREEREED